MSDTTNSELSPVKRALQEMREMRSKMEAMEQASHEPIAIIGMGCRFPGGVRNAEDLWQLLKNGVDAITEIPKERWNIDSFYDPDPDAAGKIRTRWGGFITGVDQFDPQFFGMSPREAESLDPQHRLLLEVTWEALEHSGYAPDKLTGSATGVFTGISVSDYYQLMVAQDPSKLDVYLAQGTAHSTASGRISYLLGLQGPAISIDTACSSSLVATHLAIQSLRTGECNTAIAGGVNAILLPQIHISFSRARMISSDGRCKTFDARADGFVRSEGCGIIVLKRISDAVADGDRILAVIRGSAINQDGRSNGLTAPNGLAQEAVIRSALSDGFIDPSLVSYVEAHGTGTSLGDPIEVQALGAIFGANRDSDHRLKIGSLKTNLGHLEAAAGVAGLMKAVLMLGYKQIPPHLHFESPNPYIPWSELPIDVPTKLTPLLAYEDRYIVGVSSFGFSGTNAHLILETAPEAERQTTIVERPLHLLKLSAKDKSALQALCQQYSDYLSGTSLNFADTCYTANVGRADLTYRLALSASAPKEACEKLEAYIQGDVREDIFEGAVFDTAPPEIVFMFTGHGSQYLHMSRQLFESQPTYHAALTNCEHLLKSHLDVSLFEILFPDDDSGWLNQMKYGQPALFAVEYALAQTWLSWGVKPTTVLGHSVGEYVAACIAGVFSLEDGLKMVCARGRLMDSLPQAGEMVAIFSEEETIRQVINPYGTDISIAAFNGPTNIVISGMPETLQPILDEFAARGIKTKRLSVTQAAHSHFLDPILDEFESVARKVTYHPPRLGLISCLTGRLAKADDITNGNYWRRHLRQPVRFADGIQTLLTEGYRYFLEIGPNPVLTGMAQRIEGTEACNFFPSLRFGWQDWQQILESAGALYSKGISLDWNSFDKDYNRHRVHLPTYPWTHQRYWISNEAQRAPAPGKSLQTLWQDLVRAGNYQAERGPLDLGLDTHQMRWEQLGRLSIAYIVQTLRTLDIFTQPGDMYSVDSILRKGNIKPTYHGLIARWLYKLTNVGLLHENETDLFASETPLPEIDPRPILHEARELSIDGPYLPDYLERCGNSLVSILSGAGSVLETLFPEGSFETADYLYQKMAMVRYFNGVARAVVESLVSDLPQGHQISVLEVGAGSGGTTAALIPVLPPDQTMYYFTDLSEFFLIHAEEQFKNHSFLRFGLMDLEKEPERQGYRQHSFDLVVGANVFHATKNLDEALEHALSLLKPGGILLLFETTTQPTWFESSIGLIEGWSRFEDGWRKDNPLLSPKQWTDALFTRGFVAVASWPQPGTATEILGAHILVAQAPHDLPVAEVENTLSQNQGHMTANTTASPLPAERAGVNSLIEQLNRATRDEQEELLIDYIREQVMRVTRGDRSKPPDRRQRLMEFGVDSLMAIELRNRLSNGLDLPQPLPATLIFDYPTIDVIAKYLLSKFVSENQPSVPEEEINAPIDMRESELDTLSEDEVEALLLKKLKDFSDDER